MYFERREFRCPCGECDGFPVEPQPRLVDALDGWREELGFPLVVTSGVRCARHNAAVGGAPDSRHLTGEAADVRVDGSQRRYSMLDSVFTRSRFTRVGIGSTFIHVDVSLALPQAVCWVYPAHKE